jgi:Rieske Fe-S protein
MTETSTGPGGGRRRFINRLLGSSLGATLVAILYPIIRFLVPPQIAESAQSSAVAGKVSEMRPNSGKIFRFGSKPGIVIETPRGEIRAFTAICTHLQCTVQYREDLQHIWCACHNGHYDLHGKNIAGPPPRPLEEYTVNIRGDEILASKK